MHASCPELEAALAALYERTAAGIVPGLGPTGRRLRVLGDPHRAVPVIHVAGTNGKGSVCAMIESMLRASGLRTGLYTSPHLVRFNERIRIAGEPVGDAELSALIRTVLAVDEQVVAEGDRPATFFELATVMAFQAFADAAVDIAVIETGLGGVWDATNLVDSLVSVITPISRDHANFLGSELAGIAKEKAGIIKPGRPVVIGPQVPEVMEVLRAAAAEREAGLPTVQEEVRVHKQAGGPRVRIESPLFRGEVAFPLAGPHQRDNAALAIAAVHVAWASMEGSLPGEAIGKGLEQVQWPGRMQRLSEDPVIILDGAHNPAGAESLVSALAEQFPDRTLGLVFGFSGDKDASEMLEAWQGRFACCWPVTFAHPRMRSAAELDEVLDASGWPERTMPLAEALTEARAWARAENAILCIAGSLFLVGEVLGAA